MPIDPEILALTKEEHLKLIKKMYPAASIKAIQIMVKNWEAEKYAN